MMLILKMNNLKEICNYLREQVAKLNFDDFEAFFDIGEEEDRFWATCKVCGTALEDTSDYNLLEKMAKHTLKHIDEFEKSAKSILKLIQMEKSSEDSLVNFVRILKGKIPILTPNDLEERWKSTDNRIKELYIIELICKCEEETSVEGVRFCQLNKKWFSKGYEHEYANELKALIENLIQKGWLIVKSEPVYYLNEDKVSEIIEAISNVDFTELNKLIDQYTPLFSMITREPYLSPCDEIQLRRLIKKYKNKKCKNIKSR